MTQQLDANPDHWVYRMPYAIRPFLQLSRMDRPTGYWLLVLPAWIALALAGAEGGYSFSDLIWASLFLFGAIAMRGAGCTYNDIIDRKVDAGVARTAARPLPSGTISVYQAWIWILLQILTGFFVWLFLPDASRKLALMAIVPVLIYPFMKRWTWWPQLWLGLTLNMSALVAYAIKWPQLDQEIVTLFLGLVFWTVGYDTIYACQDLDDDKRIGVKSTARLLGNHIRMGLAISYLISFSFVSMAIGSAEKLSAIIFSIPFGLCLALQIFLLNPSDKRRCRSLFSFNIFTGLTLCASLILMQITH